ncbi:MAG: hypothetical protein CMN87_15655 [Stappia sp.]|uniref:hypothetical protein n=1 Tax=Stappia sp. TaxID=1870903 RepID=UPI000C615118|nr:hypothetical protein [Stappia sp.]MAA98780.1 hypothetical protein [Stappia sp.]MBM21441.1 hypothetical protein [Stappia sp.]
MSDTHDKALNDAVGRALLDRLRTARDTDDMFADLDRLRHFAARGARAPLAEALTYLLKILPEDHPEHQKLTAELGSLPSAPAPARVQATPRPMKSEKVVPIPDTLPDLPDLANPPDDDAEWPVPPLFAALWQDERTGLRGAVRLAHACFPETLPAGLAVRAVAARSTELLHYPGFRAVEILLREADGAEVSHLAVYGTTHALQINGTSPGIHEFNAGAWNAPAAGGAARSPLRLTDREEATSYLHFFCGCVHGEDGPFSVVETQEQLQERWRGDRMPDGLADKIAPLRFEEEDAAGDIDPGKANGKAGEPLANGAARETLENRQWSIHATLLYSHALFAADFSVKPTGMIEMVQDKPVAAELPLLRDGFIDGLRIGRLAGGT